MVLIKKYFSLPWFIAINTVCWRADCEVLIHDADKAGVNYYSHLLDSTMRYSGENHGKETVRF